MLHSITDRIAKHVKNHLPNHKKEHSKRNIAQRPAILQRINHEYNLHNDINRQRDRRNEVQHHKEPNGVRGSHANPAFKCSQGDKEGDEEHEAGDATHHPDGEGGAVFVELESHEAIYEQADAECGCETVLHGCEVGVGS